MATALSYNPNHECPICVEYFKKPKTISCGHSFCLDCLVRYISDRKETFSCPVCGQEVVIPQGGPETFLTVFALQPSTDSPKETEISTNIASPSVKPKYHCPNHIDRVVDYYCQPCNLGLCSKCIYRDHNDHKTLDVESDSTREMVVEELSKSTQGLKNKLEELEKTHATLVETSKKLKTFCVEALKKVTETTEKMIRELQENCEKTQKEIQNRFDGNESQLTENKQKVMTQIKNIKTDLDTYSPSTTEEPSLGLITSLSKLKDLQTLCNSMKSDVPLMTYVEWKESNVKVCDIWGSSVTKTLYESIEGNVYKFNYNDIKRDGVVYYNKDKYKNNNMVWCCRVVRCRVLRNNRWLDSDIELPRGDNQHINYCDIKYTVTLINKDKDKNMISETKTQRFTPGCGGLFGGINIPWDKLTDQSEGFIDNEGQFLVRFDILQVIDIEYK